MAEAVEFMVIYFFDGEPADCLPVTVDPFDEEEVAFTDSVVAGQGGDPDIKADLRLWNLEVRWTNADGTNDLVGDGCVFQGDGKGGGRGPWKSNSEVGGLLAERRIPVQFCDRRIWFSSPGCGGTGSETKQFQ